MKFHFETDQSDNLPEEDAVRDADELGFDADDVVDDLLAVEGEIAGADVVTDLVD